MNKKQKEIIEYLISENNPVSVKDIRENSNLNSIPLIRSEINNLKNKNLVTIQLKINRRLSLIYLYTPSEKLQANY